MQLGAAIPAFADDPATLTTAPEKQGLTEIYINPSSGKDENSGAADSPVKTFEAARALAAANESVTTIYVKGTIPASGEWDLDLGEGREVILKRAPGFTSNMLRVPADQTLTLSNITIDGDETQNNSSTIISVTGNLVMNEGTVLQNNIKVSNWYDFVGRSWCMGIAQEEARLESVRRVCAARRVVT